MWLFLHCGSPRRRQQARRCRHIKIAQALCKQWWISLPDPDLAYLVEGTDEFWAYIRDLRWAQHFALLNRREMMNRVARCLEQWIGAPLDMLCEHIECHHNYTEREKHFGKEVWLSRKGAIDASKGKPGLIPGSMGTASYVVEGRATSCRSTPRRTGRVATSAAP